MKKQIIVIAMAFAAVFAFAQDAETVTVRGKGTGTNKTEALKDAYRDVIERAVGMYVDAKQAMENEEMVEDKILTQSNAYIEKCDVVKEKKRANGLVEVQIDAEVKKSALTKKLRDVMPKQTFALGDEAQNFHSKVVTTEKRNVDAAALLENVIGEHDPVKQLINLSLSSSKPIQALDENGKQKLYYRFKFTVNKRKYYEEFLPPLLKVLDQIALQQPKDVRLRPVDLGEDGIADQKKEYIAGKWERFDAKKDGHTKISTYHYYNDVNGVYVDDIGFSDGKGNSWCFSNTHSSCREAREYYDGNISENGEVRVMVITKMNATRSAITARGYALPPECADVILKWCRKMVKAEDKGRYSKRNPCKTTYNIVFSDKSGEEVAAMPISFENRILSNVFLGSLPCFPKGENYKHLVGLFVSPMLHCDAESLEEWIGFDIPRDQLPNIKSVTVELAE